MFENSEEDNYEKSLKKAIAAISLKNNPLLHKLLSTYAAGAQYWFNEWEKSF